LRPTRPTGNDTEARVAHSKAYRNRWTNIAVVVASAFSLAGAAQFPLELGTRPIPETVRWELWIPTVHTLAGVLGLLSLFLAIRNRGLARVVLVVAGLLLVSGFLAFERITLLPALTLGIPALLMLGAVPFLGPMPRPEEEAEAERRTR
jgi:hypothetical protein